MKLRKPMFAETKLKFKENVLNNTKKKKKKIKKKKNFLKKKKKKKKNRLKPKYF